MHVEFITAPKELKLAKEILNVRRKQAKSRRIVWKRKFIFFTQEVFGYCAYSGSKDRDNKKVQTATQASGSWNIEWGRSWNSTDWLWVIGFRLYCSCKAYIVIEVGRCNSGRSLPGELRYCKTNGDLVIDRGRLSAMIHARNWVLKVRSSRSVSAFERCCFGRNRACCWRSVDCTMLSVCAVCFSEAIWILWIFTRCLAKAEVPLEARYVWGCWLELMHFWQCQTFFAFGIEG